MLAQNVPDIAQRLPHDKGRQFADESFFFGDPNEDVRSNGLPIMISPANERFGPDATPAIDVLDRLINHPKRRSAAPNIALQLMTQAGSLPVQKGERKTETEAGKTAHRQIRQLYRFR